MIIHIAHSPDADDHFFFWALKTKCIDGDGLEFSFQAYDTAQLNRYALEGTFDVIAISAAMYPALRNCYEILPYGASVGRNYGPVVVAKKALCVEDLNGLHIGIPGLTTTAASLLRLVVPQAFFIEIPIEPFDLGFHALERSDIQALLLIHEGQISYKKKNLQLVIDLGKWWQEKTSLPLPLGLNVIRRDFGEQLITRVSRVIGNSIRYALDHSEEALEYLLQLNKARDTTLDSVEQMRKYLSMYANEEDSNGLDENVVLAMERLFSMIDGQDSRVDSPTSPPATPTKNIQGSPVH